MDRGGGGPRARAGCSSTSRASAWATASGSRPCCGPHAARFRRPGSSWWPARSRSRCSPATRTCRSFSSGARRARVLSELLKTRFDAALFALVRRDKSRWLAEAMAAVGVPWRVNLEYLDGAEDGGREPDGLFTHEAWFVWGRKPGPVLLLHALEPWLGAGEWLADRRVELPVFAAELREAVRWGFWPRSSNGCACWFRRAATVSATKEACAGAVYLGAHAEISICSKILQFALLPGFRCSILNQQ